MHYTTPRKYYVFFNELEKGDTAFFGGTEQLYVYVGKDVSEKGVSFYTWESKCVACGTKFTISTGRSGSGVTRTCPIHRKTNTAPAKSIKTDAVVEKPVTLKPKAAVEYNNFYRHRSREEINALPHKHPVLASSLVGDKDPANLIYVASKAFYVYPIMTDSEKTALENRKGRNAFASALEYFDWRKSLNDKPLSLDSLL